MIRSRSAFKESRSASRGGARFWIGAVLSGAIATQAMAQTPIPPTAKDFAQGASQSDQYEILAARDAITQSRNPIVRSFAEQMINAHSQTSESLRQAVMASGLTPPPPAMSSDQASMLAALQGLRGLDFDKTYAHQQVLAHYQALAVEESYALAGKDQNLRMAARSAVPIIQHHLQMAQKMSTALGGS